MTNRVTIWFGFFSSEEALDAYVQEETDDEGVPCSFFAEDTGVEVLAIDRLAFSFLDEPTAEPRVLLEGHETPPGLVEAVEECWAITEGQVLVNSVVVVWGDVQPAPRSVEAEDYAIVLVGSFTPSG